MDPLILRFFGSPEVIYQGQPLKFRSRKVLALLIYLVVEPGWHSREKLVALLWPESDRERGGVSLRSTIARLRRTLAAAGDFLLTGPRGISFDFQQPVELDLRRVGTAAQPEATPEACQAALATARGEFLEGFSLPDAPEFDDWVTVQGETWHRRLESVHDRLSQQQLKRGEYVQAVETAAHWVARAPLSEPAYRRLMEAHFLAGDRPAALLTFEKCQRLLRRELGVKPTAQTLALAGRIAAEPDRKPEISAAPPGPPSQLMELPLVGRSAEHSQLVTLYQQACRGNTQLVALIGEAGIGKTRLARAFVKWAALHEPAGDILAGRAFEMGGRLPYQPLVEALRARLDAENAPEDLLADVWLAELSQLLPELRDRYPDLPPPMSGDPDFVRARIFEAAARLVAALAARRPVILYVDDLQWADAGTLDLLHYLAHRCAEDKTPVLLLLTARQENMPELRDWFARLERESSLTRISLTALTATAVRKLVGVLAGEMTRQEAAVIQSFGDWLQAETGGVPFFMEAMLQMLVEQGLIPQQQRRGQAYLDVTAVWQQIQNTKRLPVPPSARAVILSRLGRLSAPAQGLLLAGAVLGRECSFERLCQVSGVAELAGLTVLEELLNSRLMLESGDEVRPYRFAHDNIRQVIYAEAGEARRRLAHRRALAVLQQANAPAAELAYHAIAIRQDDLAFRYSLAAGNAALAAHVVAEAIAHYDRAHDIAAAGVTLETDLLNQLYTCRGRALELNSQFEEALQNYREMAGLADERDDKNLRLASLSARCIIRATQTPLYDPPRARELGEAAVELARELGDGTIEARVLWGLLLVEVWGGGDKHKALAYGQRSLALARDLGLTEQKAYTLTNLVNVYWMMDQLQAAQTANRDARKLWRELGNRPMLADSYGMTLYSHWLVGEFEAGFAAGEESIRLSREVGNLWNQASNLLVMAWMYTELGELGIAFDYLDKGLHLGQEMGSQPFQYGAYRGQAWAYLLVGATDRADRLADEIFEGRNNFAAYFRVNYLSAVTRIKVRLGALQQAQSILEEAYRGLNVEDMPAFDLGNFIPAEAELLLALGEPERALAKLDYLIERLNQSGARSFLPLALWLQGKTLLALQEPQQAQRVLLEARATAEAMKLRPVLWPTLWELSQLEAAAGNHRAAERLRQHAKEVITYIAGHTGADERRASFIALPEVQALLSPA